MPSRIPALSRAMIALTAMIASAVSAQEAPAPAPVPDFPDPASIPAVEAVFVVPRFGEFRVRFFPDEVPNHVAHFLTLAGSGYYDGMSFHRVIPGYLIQAGDPSSRDMDLRNDGAGGPEYTLPAEPSERAIVRGIVSMAWRGEDPASAGSQFFIALDALPAVDGQATPVGEVIDGMETVDRISQVSTHRNRNPLDRVIIETVRLEVPGGTAADRSGEEPGSG